MPSLALMDALLGLSWRHGSDEEDLIERYERRFPEDGVAAITAESLTAPVG